MSSITCPQLHPSFVLHTPPSSPIPNPATPYSLHPIATPIESRSGRVHLLVPDGIDSGFNFFWSVIIGGGQWAGGTAKAIALQSRHKGPTRTRNTKDFGTFVVDVWKCFRTPHAIRRTWWSWGHRHRWRSIELHVCVLLQWSHKIIEGWQGRRLVSFLDLQVRSKVAFSACMGCLRALGVHVCCLRPHSSHVMDGVVMQRPQRGENMYWISGVPNYILYG